MKEATQNAPRTSRTARESPVISEYSVMLGCYDVWSATPDNDALCAEFYPARESDETTS